MEENRSTLRRGERALGPREVRFLHVRRAANMIWLLFGLLEGLIGIRILLKLIGANPASPFAVFVYRITEPFLVFFKGLTVNPSFNNALLELHSIFALTIYAFMSWAIVRLVWLVFYRPEDIQ